MSLSDANRSIEHKVILFLYEAYGFKFFSRQGRRQLDAMVLIAVKGLIGRKPRSLDQTVTLILLTTGNFLLKGSGKVLDLLRRTVLPDQIRNGGCQKQGLSAGQDTFFQLGTGGRCDHDAIASFPSFFEGRNT